MKNQYWFYPEIFNTKLTQTDAFDNPASKVVCVGRNYVEHTKELNNPVPSSPLLFMKPSTSLIAMTPQFNLPDDGRAYHYELEVALLIGKKLNHAEEKFTLDAVAGVGLALDLTIRELQGQLKSDGHPWEKAKAFDGACPVTEFLPVNLIDDLNGIEFSLHKNNQQVQAGNTRNMIFKMDYLLSEISRNFTLLPGDIVLTGTPEGVGRLRSSDVLQLSLNQQRWQSTVI